MSSITFRGMPINRQDVWRALAAFDEQYPISRRYHGWADPGNRRYILRVNGRPYPPQFVLALITRVNPEILGQEAFTRPVFEELGFETVDLAGKQPWQHVLTENVGETGIETISALGLSVRAHNALRRSGIWTIAQLAEMSDQDLYRVRNLGEKSIKEIRSVLSNYLLDHPAVEDQTVGNISSLECGDSIITHLSGEPVELSDENPLAIEADNLSSILTVVEVDEEPDGQKTRISALGLQVRAHNALTRSDIKTVGQLARMSDEDLSAVRHLGVKSIGEIRQRLDAYLVLHPLQPLQENDTHDSLQTTSRPLESESSLVAQELLLSVKHIPLTDIPIARLALSSDVEEMIRSAGIRSIGDLLKNTNASFGTHMPSDARERTKQYLEWLLLQDSETWEEEIANRSISPLFRLELRGITVETWIADRISFLSAREKFVLTRRFGLVGQVQTFEELGQELQVTRERARQIENRALRALHLPVRRVRLLPLNEAVVHILSEHAGVMLLRSLVGLLARAFGVRIGIVDPYGLMRLIAEVFGEIVVSQRQGVVHLKSIALANILEVQRELVNIVRHREMPLSRKSILMRFKETDLYQKKSGEITDDFILACLRSINRIERDEEGLYVVRMASLVRKSYVIRAMRAIGEPTHYSEIAVRFNELVPEKQRLSDHNLHAYLGRFPDIFARVGHGVYGLTEWGLSNDGKVANTAYRVLRDAGGPLHIDVLTPAVLQTWSVNPTTVHAAVESDERFVRIGRGVYALRDSITGETSSETTIDFGDIYAHRLALWQQEIDLRKSPTIADARSEVDALRSLGADFFGE